MSTFMATQTIITSIIDIHDLGNTSVPGHYWFLFYTIRFVKLPLDGISLRCDKQNRLCTTTYPFHQSLRHHLRSAYYLAQSFAWVVRGIIRIPYQNRYRDKGIRIEEEAAISCFLLHCSRPRARRHEEWAAGRLP